MRQLWVGIIVVIVALALGLGAAYGASLLVRNQLASLPSIRRSINTPPTQPGNNNNSRRFINPFMNPGGQQGFGPFGFYNWGGRGRMPLPGPGTRNFNNCPVPNQGQTQNNCPPFNGTPAPNNGTPVPNNGGNGPF